MKTILEIYIIIKNKSHEYKYIELENEWKKYFDINVCYLSYKKINNIFNNKVDFIFVDEEIENNLITREWLHKLKKTNTFMRYIRINKAFDISNAYIFFKEGADDLMFLETGKEYLKWKSIALLRRRTREISIEENVVSYKGLILDKINFECVLNNKPIELSKKEFQFLKILVDAAKKNEFITRSYIYKTIWKYNDNDPTRVVQQIIQNLKRKIGNDYFKIVRNKGIKLQ